MVHSPLTAKENEMIHIKTGNVISKFVSLVVFCVILNACNTQDNAATFSGTLIDVDGKPIGGHIVMVYPIEMSETGSSIYHPITTIAASPGFITVRTKSDGSFAIKERINKGTITIGLMPTNMLDIINNPKKANTAIRSEYQLISVKIGVMTYYGDRGTPGSIVFSLPTEKKFKDVVIVARQEMWIEGKVVFNDKKPVADAPITFKITTRKQDKSDESRYGDQILTTDAKGNFWYGLFHHPEPKLYKVSVIYQELTAESKEFLIQGGSQYKGLVLKLNGDSSDIPENPKPPEPVLRPGMMRPPTELTPQDWIVNPYNGHAYVRIMCEGHDAAKGRAAAEGAYLVAINDVEEQKWVSSTFGNELYWIGLHKTDNGQWLWDNEEPIDYTNWGPEDRFTEDILAKSEKVGAVMTFVEGEWHAVAPGDLFWDYTIYAILEKSSWETGTTSEDR